MDTSLTQIGNSRGVIIPAGVLRACGFENAVTMTVESGRLILTPGEAHLADWDRQFKAAGAPHELTEEELDFLNTPNEWDETEWTW